MTVVLIGERNGRFETQRHKEEGQGKTRQRLKFCCRKPKDTKNQRKPEKTRKDHGLAATLIFNSWLPEL